MSAGKFSFVVEPFTEDCCGRLSWRFLGNHLLRCASIHAGQHGFGYDDMQEQHHAWVLSRIVVEMNTIPTTGEAYNVETWVKSAYRQFTDRLYAITDNAEGIYGYAFSTWALIDVTTRQPMNLADLPNGGFKEAIIARDIPLKAPSRIRLKQPQVVRQQNVQYSDLDINGHVNSVRYIEMMLDLLPEACHQPVRHLEVAYSAEAHFGDTLTFRVDTSSEATEQPTHLIEVLKDGETVVARGVITFKA